MALFTNFKFLSFILLKAALLSGIVFSACSNKDANQVDVFYIEVVASLDEDHIMSNRAEYFPLLDLFNNTSFVYYHSDRKQKLVHNLNLGDQKFKSTETFQEGKVGEYRFVEYLGSQFKMENEKNTNSYQRGIDWDIVEIKDRKKDFFGYECNFAEGFSIIDGVEYTISGYICPSLEKRLRYIQPTEIMDIDGAWVEANVRVEGLNLEYKIVRHENIHKEEFLFPHADHYDLVDYDDEFTEGFTNWLQN